MEEDDVEVLSISDTSDSGEDFTCEESEDGDDSLSRSDSDENSHGNDVARPAACEQKSQNVDALLRGNLVVKRQSLLPRVYSVSEREAVLKKPFKPPCADGYSNQNEQLIRRLCARKRFVPWGSNRPALIPITNRLNAHVSVEAEVPEEVTKLPPDIEPLILWQPENLEDGDCSLIPIEVDHILVKFLRPHQREGVQFMFECVTGLCTPDINGCILADDMGLGKTLQSITLLYTLLRQGFDGKPLVKKAIIVTPTSLVSNWEAEIKKWVGERVKLVALCESSRDDVISSIDSFRSPRSRLQVLIVSYETFRMHSSKFNDSGSCDLLICDEAHRLKNDQTLTNRALAALSCKRRILLSGTPMQNHLEEFYAMVNFTNPGILGDAAFFRRYYETPIICGREPTASEEEKHLANERSAELSAKVNQFILRRTNALLSNHLPPKIVEVVCCKLTPLQKELYTHFIHSKNVKQAIAEDVKQTKVLAYITALKKLCNHPKLIYDTMKSGNPGTAGFEGCMRFFPPEMFAGRSGSWTGGDGAWVELSGKMHVLARLLGHLRTKTDDRIVLVSNYTQTLDLIVQLCRERRYPFLRLDGTTSISKRQKLVNCFNDQSKDEFAFLLSSKAGGCGLNLIGGNRLVLFDPDWNPANDKQAAARVWRDGQKKRVYIYRFLSTGTIEEKVYQRQMSKEGLQKVIQQELADSKMQGNNFSTEDLRDLFTFYEDATSEIHGKMNCTRCGEHTEDAICMDEEEDIGGFAGISGCLHNLKRSEKQVGAPLEEDLANWGHHFSPNTVPDTILQASAGDEVTFVFTNQISGKLVPVEPVVKSRPDDGNRSRNTDTHSLKGNSLKSYTISSKRQHTIPSAWSKSGPASVRNKLSTSIRTSHHIGEPKEIKTHVASKLKPSLENYLPQKRFFSGPVDDDDDFA
ncbi:putative DNA helicase chromatin remodeling SNF2 family [Helianthus annuus]|uniref:DNA helicase chromatin remodeling SNF2 family n=1 Tax=Helianthus annuus TaxID=4232 RepID=A0A251RVD2_HELAN|nr:protein CHROMATIN REMODELING 25 [Helianthus annuus]KAF5757912.1 putative DNA helicase chromatin remodeling SNF2 family [Helianthus annuus]KAJ0436351.1 putative DNA helicase chromatin remodeling SNF2 family [Helianthus annuus]KAJ0440486.1 putative DNA helicase chromatin remodeling SNF2 family [Helianthus annuus]KAJ0639165.1 putative DNA helicase chromatin remodeling SNF2 family [Helianthus annuus]KAJ0643131.1 putative DNA helicase chromatin remodeling SNF2 family [Helianthus annuus]